MKWTVTSCQTEQFFIGKSDSFQELCTMVNMSAKFDEEAHDG